MAADDTKKADDGGPALPTTEDNPGEPGASGAAGWNTIINSAPVQHMLDFGGNLDAYRQMVQAATAGDPNAQALLAQHSLATAAGTIAPVEAGAAQGLIPKAQTALGMQAAPIAGVEGATALSNATEQGLASGLTTPAQMQAATNAKSRAMDFAARTAKGRKNFAEGGMTEAPAQPTPEAPAPPEGVNVINPSGDLVSIDPQDLQGALNSGYQHATPEHIEAYQRHEKYGGLGQQALAGAEGAASAATFGASTAAEVASGLTTPEDIRQRREEHPGTHMIGQGTGLIGSSLLLPGAGAAGALEAAGAGAAKMVGLGAAEGALAKIGSGVVKSAAENALFQSGDEVSKMFSGASDPSHPVETALTDIGLAGVIGGGFGTVSPLWKATIGGKLSGLLKGITDKTGGIEGAQPDAVESLIHKTGIDIAPEVRAALSNNPELQQAAKTLEQSDTTKSGLAYQESLNNFKKQASESMVRAFGKDPEAVAGMEMSKYEAGKKIGKDLAAEYDAQVKPISAAYDEIASKYKGIDLEPTLPEQAPGTLDKISEGLGKLADTEGWTKSPGDPIVKQFNEVVKELPLQKTAADLDKFIKNVGNRFPWNPMDGSMYRAGRMIKEVLRNAQDELIGKAIGSEEGEAALAQYQATRRAYAAQSEIRDAIDSRLHAKGSTSGYGKAVREMAQTDGETLLNRISGKNDADLLNILQKHLPNTAESLKSYHIDNLIQTAVSKAKAGETFNSAALIKALDSMSPEMRAFAVPAKAAEQVKAVGSLLEQLNRLPHNFSNSARVMDSLLNHVPGSALGLATAISTHNPVLALLAGGLAKYIGRDVPDAIRLSMLKFMGSSKSIEPGAFKSMVDFAHNVSKGENLVVNATKNLFKAGKDVIPQARIPSESDRKKLDKNLKAAQDSPQSMMKVGGDIGHYLPEHATAVAQLAANAANFLNGIRPNMQPKSPLDTKHEPSLMQKAAYNRALDIAQQPLMVVDAIKRGTLTPSDVLAVKTLYPGLYQRLSEKITAGAIEAVHKGEAIPYKQRVGMSMFLGQPLDSTMSPESIMSAQPMAPQGPQQQQQPQQGMAKKSANALNKLAPSARTPGQTSEQRRSEGH